LGKKDSVEKGKSLHEKGPERTKDSHRTDGGKKKKKSLCSQPNQTPCSKRQAVFFGQLARGLSRLGVLQGGGVANPERRSRKRRPSPEKEVSSGLLKKKKYRRLGRIRYKRKIFWSKFFHGEKRLCGGGKNQQFESGRGGPKGADLKKRQVSCSDRPFGDHERKKSAEKFIGKRYLEGKPAI